MKKLLMAGALFAITINCNAQTSGQNKAKKEFIDNSVPLNKANNLYALANGWKTYNDEWGYTISFPKNISDGGTTASGIHYYNRTDVDDMSVEAYCLDNATKLTDELSRWYNSELKDIDIKVYTVAKKELIDNSFLIVKKNKDGSGISYEKCIVGIRCLFFLKISVDNDNRKMLSEQDIEVVLNLFKPAKVISKKKNK